MLHARLPVVNDRTTQKTGPAGGASTPAVVGTSKAEKSTFDPLPWIESPPQSVPEREQALADIHSILANPELEFGLVPRMTSQILYAFSGAELKRILLGLAKLLETNEPPPLKPLKCRQCGILDAPKLQWQDCQGGKRHIRASCTICGAWIKFVSRSPAAVAEANKIGQHENRCGTERGSE